MFRTVLISKSSKLQSLQEYLVIYDGVKETKVLIDDISVLLIESNRTLVTVPLLVKLAKKNVAIIFCDEKHNPSATLLGMNNNYATSFNIYQQVNWDGEIKENVWTKIVKLKIQNQLKVLKKLEKENYDILEKYIDEIELNDSTNREGLAAKVYFFSLFGKNFNRNEQNVINEYLNYGYSILLSLFNREIVSSGYLTQLGIFHRGKTNPYNFSSDLMEPFRPIIDYICYMCINCQNVKEILRQFSKVKINYNGEKRYIEDCVRLFVQTIVRGLNKEKIIFPEMDFESIVYKNDKSDENNSDV